MIHHCSSVSRLENLQTKASHRGTQLPEQLNKPRSHLCPAPHPLLLAQLFQKVFSSELLCATLSVHRCLAPLSLLTGAPLQQQYPHPKLEHLKHHTEHCQPAHQSSTICQRTAGQPSHKRSQSSAHISLPSPCSLSKKESALACSHCKTGSHTQARSHPWEQQGQKKPCWQPDIFCFCCVIC